MRLFVALRLLGGFNVVCILVADLLSINFLYSHCTGRSWRLHLGFVCALDINHTQHFQTINAVLLLGLCVWFLLNVSLMTFSFHVLIFTISDITAWGQIRRQLQLRGCHFCQSNKNLPLFCIRQTPVCESEGEWHTSCHFNAIKLLPS